MFLLSSANPLNDLIGLLNEANPDLGGYLTADNVAIQNIIEINAEENDGRNAQGDIIYTGADETTGIVQLKWTRIDLNDVFPYETDAKIIVELPQLENNGIYPAELENIFSAGLGTKILATGDYVDYTAGSFSSTQDVLKTFYITIQSTSLRYVPGRFYLNARPIGRGLAQVVSAQSVTPYTSSIFELPSLNLDNKKRLVGDTTASSYHLMAMLDFTSALGRIPAEMIVDGYWDPDVFININTILATHGLPPLPTDEVGTTSYVAGNLNGNSIGYENHRQYFGILLSGMPYNYYELINADYPYVDRIGYLTFGYNSNDKEL